MPSSPSALPTLPPSLRWQQWLLEFLLLASIWGASFLFMRVAAQDIGPLPTAWLRVLIAAVFLLPLLYHQGHGRTLQQHWRKTLFVGAINSGIPFACYSFAVLSISTGLSSILNATTPLFGALVAWLWLGERLTHWRVAGLALGFGGALLLAWSMPGGISFRPGGSGWAVAACLLATLCYGISGSFTQRHLQGVPAMVTATGSQIGATLLLGLPAWWAWPGHAPALSSWLALLAVGVLCSALAYILYFRLIARMGSSRALTVTYLVPVVATSLGVALLHEAFTAWTALSAALIMGGTALASGLIAPRPQRQSDSAN